MESYGFSSDLSLGNQMNESILQSNRLTRLKNAGLLNYRWEESTSGPPRKYYGLTETGKLFLKELNTTWSELQNAVNLVTSTKTTKK